MDRKENHNTKIETETSTEIQEETETPTVPKYRTTRVHNEETEILNRNDDGLKLPPDATYKPTNDVDMVASITKNPYVDKNVDFSTEFLKDKDTYINTTTRTKKN